MDHITSIADLPAELALAGAPKRAVLTRAHVAGSVGKKQTGSDRLLDQWVHALGLVQIARLHRVALLHNFRRLILHQRVDSSLPTGLRTKLSVGGYLKPVISRDF